MGTWSSKSPQKLTCQNQRRQILMSWLTPSTISGRGHLTSSLRLALRMPLSERIWWTCISCTLSTFSQGMTQLVLYLRLEFSQRSRSSLRKPYRWTRRAQHYLMIGWSYSSIQTTMTHSQSLTRRFNLCSETILLTPHKCYSNSLSKMVSTLSP